MRGGGVITEITNVEFLSSGAVRFDRRGRTRTVGQSAWQRDWQDEYAEYLQASAPTSRMPGNAAPLPDLWEEVGDILDNINPFDGDRTVGPFDPIEPSGGAIIAAPLVPLAVAILSRAGSAGGGFAFAGRAVGAMGGWRGLLRAAGAVTLFDFVGEQFGIDLISDDERGLQGVLDSLEGAIKPTALRRDGTPMPRNYLTINAQTGEAWWHSEYYSKNFINAVRRDERTPRYRGKPTPGGGRNRKR